MLSTRFSGRLVTETSTSGCNDPRLATNRLKEKRKNRPYRKPPTKRVTRIWKRPLCFGCLAERLHCSRLRTLVTKSVRSLASRSTTVRAFGWRQEENRWSSPARTTCTRPAVSNRGRLAGGRVLRRFGSRTVHSCTERVHPLLIRFERASGGNLQILQGIVDPGAQRCINGLRGSCRPLVGGARGVHTTRMCSIAKTDNERQGSQDSQLHGDLLPAKGCAIAHHGMKVVSRGATPSPTHASSCRASPQFLWRALGSSDYVSGMPECCAGASLSSRMSALFSGRNRRCVDGDRRIIWVRCVIWERIDFT
jgi:hypothetical protein